MCRDPLSVRRGRQTAPAEAVFCQITETPGTPPPVACGPLLGAVFRAPEGPFIIAD